MVERVIAWLCIPNMLHPYKRGDDTIMRIAISADNRAGLEAPISPHFGRCPYYVLADVEGDQITIVQTVENPYFSQHEPGAVPEFIRRQGVQVMLTGGMGHRAVDFFIRVGIQPVTGVSGTVQEAISRYLKGELTGVAPCAESIAHGH
jgi:predicted Fe-Mo cluster-binding NifX family protein